MTIYEILEKMVGGDKAIHLLETGAVKVNGKRVDSDTKFEPYMNRVHAVNGTEVLRYNHFEL